MIEYEEDWIFPLLFRWQGSVYGRAAWFALPGMLVSIGLIWADDYYPDFRDQAGVAILSDSVVWAATTAVLLTMVGFRAKQGYSRFWEGTGLLHQMKGEWFDTISNCVTFSVSAKNAKPKDVDIFRHTIVRLMSLCHASALEEISGNDNELETIDVRGLDLGTLKHLKSCVEEHGFNKVEVLLHLIQTLITTAQSNGVLAVPPPILSRVYQTCSRGYVNLLNTKKITDTKFPFPFVQLITFLLLLHTLFTPMVLTAVLAHHFFAPLVTFVALFGTYSLNFIAVELENPFGQDDNDLPLGHFQAEMNNCLMMLLHYDTDIVATTSPCCVTDFMQLKRSVELGKFDGCEKEPGWMRRMFGSLVRESVEREKAGNSVERPSASRQSRVSSTQSRPSGRFSCCTELEAMSEDSKEMKPIPEELLRSPEGSKEFDADTHLFDYPRGIGNEDAVDRRIASPKAKNDERARGVPEVPVLPEVRLLGDQDLTPILLDRMAAFNRSLQLWTQQLDGHVRELSEKCTELRHVSLASPMQHIPSPAESAPALAMPVQFLAGLYPDDLAIHSRV